MATQTTTTPKASGFMKESLEQAQARLEAFEKEASRVLDEVRARSKTSRKEIEHLVAKVQAGELFKTPFDKKELVAKAGKLGGEALQRFQEVQDRVYKFVGIASREQVNELMGELEKLSRKLNRLTKGAKAAAAAGKRKTKGPGLDA